jgi:membrane protein
VTRTGRRGLAARLADARRAAELSPAARSRTGGAAAIAVLRFVTRGGGYHAAALTYYSVLSLFPAAGLAYALLGVVGADSAVSDVGDALQSRAVEQQFVTAVRATVRSAVYQHRDEAAIAVAVSVGAAVYLAGRWARGASRGLDAVLDRPHRGSGLRFLRQLRDTIVLVLLFVGAILLAFAGGAIGRELFGDALSFLWRVGAWALAAIVGTGAYAYVYAFAPSPPRLPREALLAGAVTGMLVWVLATLGFSLFADLWPGYDTNYGVFAALIVALIWLWLTNVSVLLGGAFAGELALLIEKRQPRRSSPPRRSGQGG